MFRHEIESGLWIELFRPIHAPSLFAKIDANREHLRRWLPWVDPTKCELDTMNYIKKTLRQFAEGTSTTVGIWADGNIVGGVGLHDTRPNETGEIGYWLVRGAEGRGYVTKACRSMIAYGFEELKLHRVVIRCATDNSRSRGVPERLGFRQEGIHAEASLLNGVHVDLVSYALLARDAALSRTPLDQPTPVA
ncbi:MAG TPA: GNAT family protein [Candidatus Eisenbacteria bacterium]|nr:GNAT family protein [Candidatus Eisenbacteria bacterium]